MTPEIDVITPEQAGTLAGLFHERVRRTPDHCAYRFYDALNGAWADCAWSTIAHDVRRWQAALAEEDLEPGDRVAIMAHNSRFWVALDQAALGMGLVVVPVYTEDRADNVAYLMDDAGVKLLVVGGEAEWNRLNGQLRAVRSLTRIVSIAEIEDPGERRLVSLHGWIRGGSGRASLPPLQADDLATIVYTSGTTGRPKGVMLSHRNLLSNAHACLQTMQVRTQDVFLSFLPLSHTLERTVGYYLPMMAGAVVAHARGVPELAQDLRAIRPDGLISVPRIYERVYSRIKDGLQKRHPVARRLFDLTVAAGWNRFEHVQGRAGRRPVWYLWPLLRSRVAERITQRLGGNLRVAVSGGAALSPEIAKTFIALGVPILQGYGLTEASPVVSVNRLDDNVPASIGRPVPGVEVAIGENEELLVRGPNVMLGFWNQPEETRRVIDAEGWLHTGDKARIEDGRIYLTGRIKEIIVLSNGEKVSPADMEIAIAADPLFEQVLIIGEARPYLTALAVLNDVQWRRLASERGFDAAVNSSRKEKLVLARLSACLREFPGYAQIYHLAFVSEPWSVDNGLLTPTMKIKRARILERYAKEIEQMYEGHR